ncbi:MAG: hypothetical protein FWG06_04710 [Clostridiales bacterium]|nr:hypothetical protein [Clostridiales bacterium]
MWRLYLRMLLKGRYGFDKLGRFLLLSGLLMHLLAIAIRQGHIVLFLQFAGFALMLLALLRLLSRNISAREREAQRFAVLCQRWAKGLSVIKREAPRLFNGEFWVERRLYKFYRCPRCAARLRLPRGKGQMRITCPRCGYKMQGKT